MVLFSDYPHDESEVMMTTSIQNDNQINSSKPTTTLTNSKAKFLCVKICDSEWHDLVFDDTKIQGDSIQIRDKQRHFVPTSLYEIVANVQFLPSPFNFSKIIEFKPRYMVVNKTYETIQLFQAECEENGVFKCYPQESSVFHWTDSTKPLFINIKVENHELSGNIKIGGIGEIIVRLRGQYESESMILNISIQEERNTLFIIFNDVSYAPPYRIENMTKTSFKIQQTGARAHDFDMLRPYQIIPFAWSYPLNTKELKISICYASNEIKLDSIKFD